MKPGKFELWLAFSLLVALGFLIGAAPRQGSKRRQLWKIGRTTSSPSTTTTTTETTTMASVINKQQCNFEECCKNLAHITCRREPVVHVRIRASRWRVSKRRQLWKIGRTTPSPSSASTTTTTSEMTTVANVIKCNIEECCKKMAHMTCRNDPKPVPKKPVRNRKYSPTLTAVNAVTAQLVNSRQRLTTTTTTTTRSPSTLPVTPPSASSTTTTTSTRSPSTLSSPVLAPPASSSTAPTNTISFLTVASTTRPTPPSSSPPSSSPRPSSTTTTSQPPVPTTISTTTSTSRSTTKDINGFLSEEGAEALLISGEAVCSCFEPETGRWTDILNLTDLVAETCPRARRARSVMEPLPSPVYCTDEELCTPFFRRSRECVDYLDCSYPCGDTRACKIVPIEPDEYGNCLEWTCQHHHTPEEISVEVSSIAGAIFGALSLIMTCMYVIMRKCKYRLGRRGLYRELSETDDPFSGHPLDDAINSGDSSVQEGNNSGNNPANNPPNAAGNNPVDPNVNNAAGNNAAGNNAAGNNAPAAVAVGGNDDDLVDVPL